MGVSILLKEKMDMSSSKTQKGTRRASTVTLSVPAVKRCLIKARALLAKGWMQGSMAALSNGEICAARDPRAAFFCLRGAVDCATNYKYDLATGCIEALYEIVEKTDKYIGLVGWNDMPSRTQAEVLTLFDDAIAQL